MLTPSGLIHAFVLANILLWSLGRPGYFVGVAYFLFGYAVTKFRFKEKTAAGIAESRGGRRGPENVWGSAGVASIAAICASLSEAMKAPVLGITADIWKLGFVASFATKLADTFASEIGKGFGKTTFLITSLRRVPPGTEGAVSLEGTLGAVVGGAILSFVGVFLGVLSGSNKWQFFRASVLASFLATNFESVLGATVQEKSKILTNEVINFINTFVGCLIAIWIGKGVTVGTWPW